MGAIYHGASLELASRPSRSLLASVEGWSEGRRRKRMRVRWWGFGMTRRGWGGRRRGRGGWKNG